MLKEYLRALQLHIFEFGIAEYVLSDSGSQLVAGANVVADLLKDVESRNFFDEHNMKITKLEQYFKGSHALGSLVESCVKLTRKLINSSIKTNILPFCGF